MTQTKGARDYFLIASHPYLTNHIIVIHLTSVDSNMVKPHRYWPHGQEFNTATATK